MKVIDPDKLRTARLEAGYTQRGLASLARCTQATISGLETGAIANTSLDLATAVARWLNLEVDVLFERDPTRPERFRRSVNALGTHRSPR